MDDLAATGVVSPENALSEVKRKLLAKYALGHFSSEAAPTIRRRPPGRPVPLSLFQEQIWRYATADNEVPSFYNELTTIHRYGELDRTALERSFTEILRRHEAWRTTFDTIDGQVVQVIRPGAPAVDIPFIDLRGIPEPSRRAEALRFATEDARRPFDLKQGPLVRTLLITVDDREHLFFVTMHQIITDGVSVYQVLPLELTLLYAAFSNSQEAALPPLPIQYGDFAYAQRRLLTEEVITRETAYWQNVLARELPLIKWPRDGVRASSPHIGGAIQPFALPKRLSDELTDLSRRESVTLFMVVLAAFAALLSRYTGEEDIITGTVAPAGRKWMEVQSLLGYFLNPVALRIDLSGNPTVHDLLRRCREITSGALSHDNVPLECLMEKLAPDQYPVRRWPFNMGITLAPPLPPLSSGWGQTPMDCDTGWAKWDLYVELSLRTDGIIGRAQYRTDVFEPPIIAQLIQDFEKVLESFLLNRDQHISEFLPCIQNEARLIA